MMNGPIHSVHRPVDSSQLFQMLEALLTKGLGGQSCEQADMRASVASADFLSILLGEFSGTGQGGFGGYRQPLSFHTQVLSAFEGGALDEVLRIGMAALGAAVQIFQGGVSQDAGLVQLTSSVIELTCDTVGWEFSSGRNSWELTSARLASTSGSLIRPPERWRQALIRPDFLGAVFAVYDVVRGQPKTQDLAHGVRQLLLLLSSVTGTVFENEEQRLAYASFLVDGCLAALRKLHEYNQRRAQTNPNEEDEATIAETVDLCSMICRLVANFRLQRLSKLPSFPTLLDAVASLGNDLLHQNLAACQQVDGNLEDYADSNEGRDEALGQLLEGTVLMAEDPWLLGGAPGEEETVRMVTAILAKSLAPLYQSYISTRIGMARLEETFFFSRDLDEVREEISSAAADEEMTSAASLGRMDVSASVACLSFFLNQSLPRLQAMWEIPGGVMLPETAALLEEVRLLIVCVAHILTDECDGETPSVPDAVARACSLSCSGDAANATTASVSGLVQSLISLAELQASRVAADPSDVRLSPLLAKTLLWFFKRWAPSYVLTRSNEYSKGRDMLTLWSSGEAALQAVSFCCALCIHYNCQWPHEGQVQEEATALLLALARRGKDIRGLLVLSQPFEQIATLHSITAGLRHSASDEEIGSAVSSAGNENLPLEMVRGYQRLPYEQRSKVLTALLVGSSEPHDARAVAISQLCLRAVHGPFASLVQALITKQISADDVHAQEMACLCVDMYGGAARASEMSDPEKVPEFMTPSLQHLSGLMVYYAHDLTVCERLLCVFRDYAEQFIAMLKREQCLALFQASADLLKSYSAHHCASRVVKRPMSSVENDLEEEQSYGDVLCAIQLLIHLGTKDFIDICTTNEESGVDSSHVTNVIFLGLQQILPLMTQGLLQFPNLCLQYFSLVGSMMDTYPDKVCELPYDLFRGLLDSLIFGMSHSNAFVSKSSLQGIGGIAREHLKNGALRNHLAGHADIFDACSHCLLQQVVFQTIIWDRLEPAGMALLALAAVDLAKFAAIITSIVPQFGSIEKQQRVQAAFEQLMQPGVLSKVSSGGYEGRMNRLKFKKDFELFVRDIHSFLVIQ